MLPVTFYNIEIISKTTKYPDYDETNTEDYFPGPAEIRSPANDFYYQRRSAKCPQDNRLLTYRKRHQAMHPSKCINSATVNRIARRYIGSFRDQGGAETRRRLPTRSITSALRYCLAGLCQSERQPGHDVGQRTRQDHTTKQAAIVGPLGHADRTQISLTALTSVQAYQMIGNAEAMRPTTPKGRHRAKLQKEQRRIGEAGN
jgi:hypothetical protein